MTISAIRLSMRLIISANNLVPLYSGFQKDKSPVNHKEKGTCPGRSRIESQKLRIHIDIRTEFRGTIHIAGKETT